MTPSPVCSVLLLDKEVLRPCPGAAAGAFVFLEGGDGMPFYRCSAHLLSLHPRGPGTPVSEIPLEEAAVMEVLGS